MPFTARQDGSIIYAEHINEITRSLGRPVVPAIDSGFSWINQGAAAVATAGDFVVLTLPTGAVIIRGRARPAPAAPYTVTAKLSPQAVIAGTSAYGIFVAEAGATPKMVLFGIQWGSGVMNIEKWNSPTSYNSAYTTPNNNSFLGNQPFWLRINDDNTNRICQVSREGEHWNTFHTVGRTDFLTTPTQVGFYMRNETGVNADLALVSWEGA